MSGRAELLARLLRRQLRRAAQMWRYRRWSLADAPVLFANSFPKSGTHLLTQILQGFTRIGPAVDSGLPAITTFTVTGQRRSLGEILADLRRLNAGDISYGHLYSQPEVLELACGNGWATFFIYRDPRDVVVSHVHYITEMSSRHAHHQYYVQELGSFDERLTVSILGRPEWGELFPDIAARFEPYLGWLERDEVLALRYEDFLADSTATLRRILDHAVLRGFPLSCDRSLAIRTLANSLDPHRSPTFRRGKAGGWRERFTAEHKRLFKQVAGELLIRLGYEQDFDW